MHEILLRCVRGIETIAADEVAARIGVEPIAVDHRELRLRALLGRDLLELGTVDDAFLVLGEVDGVGRQREGLARVAAAARSLDLHAAARELGAVRRVSGPRTFDVVGSFLGRRNWNRTELEDALGGAVRGWSYRRRAGRPPGRTTLSLRAHVVGERATIAVRIAARPLHLRPYRVVSRPGALHPPLARALAVVAGGGVLVDPCCGTGTVAIEAALADPSRRVLGFDVDADALSAARANARAACVPLALARADAGALPLRDASVEAAAANLPWDRTVPARGLLRHSLEPMREELLRVLRPGSRAALLVPPDAFPHVEDRTGIRVAGARASIVVLNG
jgi:tRNA (guanine6-N2)-methyltransferase